MRQVRIGDITIDAVIEREGPWRRPQDFFPAYDEAVFKHHLPSMEPEVFDLGVGMMVITYQTFVVRTPREFQTQFVTWIAAYLAGFYIVFLVWRWSGFRGDFAILPAGEVEPTRTVHIAFTATRDGGTLTLVTSGTTYTLKKAAANPLARPANPLSHP